MTYRQAIVRATGASALLGFFCMLGAAVMVPAAMAYDYPVKDPYIATVFGTPPAQKALPDRAVPHREQKIDIFPGRELPDIVMANRYRYGTAFQEYAAPLVFVIAGTGSSHQGGKMKLLESTFYKAGFHVVTLSSPTYANFIMTASESHIPGNGRDDAEDLYRVMQRILQVHDGDIQVTGYHLTGYSLGGANAGFVAELDSRQKAIGFSRVMMINPPVNLYQSMRRLDEMLQNNIPGPVAEDFDLFFNDILARVSRAYIETDDVDFNDELVYHMFISNLPDSSKARRQELEAIIGTSFRFASANMVTVADFAAQRGFLIPRRSAFSVGESTTAYFKVAMQVSFLEYLEQLYLPYFRERYPAASRSELIRQTSLTSLEDFLGSARHVAVVHNADDIILGGQELDYLRSLMGERLQLYPHGGHLGNLDYPQNLEDLVEYFTD